MSIKATDAIVLKKSVLVAYAPKCNIDINQWRYIDLGSNTGAPRKGSVVEKIVKPKYWMNLNQSKIT